jgi:DNA mismatch repair ATPase MutL
VKNWFQAFAFKWVKLYRYATLNRQPLIAPSRLDLTAAEEQTVHQHMETFLANGEGCTS